MYLTIRKYGGCGEVKEINRIAVAELLPELRKVAGFRSYTIVDTGSNSGLAIGMFDSRAAAEIANERARTVVMRTALKDLLPNPPEIIVGEVLSDSK